MSIRQIFSLLLGLWVFTPSIHASPLLPKFADWEEKLSASMHAIKSGQAEMAVQLCDEAIEEASHFNPTDTRLARAQVQRAQLYLWFKDNNNALKLLNAAIASCERAVGPNGPELVHPLSSLANYYTYIEPNTDRVIALFTRILGIAEAAQVRSEMVIWSRNLALAHQQAGHFAEAEPLYARSVELTEKDVPELVTNQMLTQAQFYRAWKKYDRAREIAQQALTRREQALKSDPDNIDRKLDVSVALDELTAIQLASGQLEQAEVTARRSLSIAESFMDPDNADRGPRLELLVDALRARAKFTEAASSCQQLLALTERILGKESLQYANVAAKYATILRDLKKPEEAAKYESEAAAIRGKQPAAG